MEYKELLNEANEHIERLKTNDIFFVKDLFPGTKWNALARYKKK